MLQTNLRCVVAETRLSIQYKPVDRTGTMDMHKAINIQWYGAGDALGTGLCVFLQNTLIQGMCVCVCSIHWYGTGDGMGTQGN